MDSGPGPGPLLKRAWSRPEGPEAWRVDQKR